MTIEEGAQRDEEAVLRFIERFASILADAGMARMPSRVFAALLATDSGWLTAAELAEILKISPAAISAAIRYLVQLNVATREREPGSRRDRYRILDDVWYEATLRRDQMLVRWHQAASEGVEVLGPDTPAGQRIAETLAYLEFVQAEMPTMLKRWEGRKAQLRSGSASGD